MDVRSCKECGKLFNYVSGLPLCPACNKLMDDKFAVVKQYIYDNPGAGINEVSRENDVSTAVIKRWIREERLSFAENSEIGIDCERCGKMIRSGRYCENCKTEMQRSFGNAYPKQKKPEPKRAPKDNPKMRFLNN
ncbi:MAG: flagellar protein [Lachnospiraceae bacterium]|nr:flagellar protein [Lachnospiraceae bacterium]